MSQQIDTDIPDKYFEKKMGGIALGNWYVYRQSDGGTAKDIFHYHPEISVSDPDSDWDRLVRGEGKCCICNETPPYIFKLYIKLEKLP